MVFKNLDLWIDEGPLEMRNLTVWMSWRWELLWALPYWIIWRACNAADIIPYLLIR